MRNPAIPIFAGNRRIDVLAEVLKAIAHLHEGELSERRLELLKQLGTAHLAQWRTANEYTWAIRRGKRLRRDDVSTFRLKGKTLVRLHDVWDLITAGLVARALGQAVQHVLPIDDMVAGAGGTIPQRVPRALHQELLRQPSSWVVRFDIRECFENIPRKLALQALTKVGPPEDLVQWLRTFYADHGYKFRGVGRGLAFGPAIQSAYLLSLFLTLRDRSNSVAWIGDDFACVVNSEHEARNLLELAKDELAHLGLQMHEDSQSKFYVGPATGCFTFAGHDYDNLLISPKVNSLTKLTEMLIAQNLPDDEKLDFFRAWLGQYPAAVGSTKLDQLIKSLEPTLGSELTKQIKSSRKHAIYRAARTALPRRSGRKSHARSPSNRCSAHSTFSLRLSKPNTFRSHPNMPPVLRNNCAKDPVQTARASKPAVWTQTDFCNLSSNPDQCHPMPWGTFRAQAFNDPETLKRLENVVRSELPEHLGYSCLDAFLYDRVGCDPIVARRLIELGQEARETAERADELARVYPATSLLKALSEVVPGTRPNGKDKFWWPTQRKLLLELNAIGRVSSKSAQHAIRRALRRAHQQVGQHQTPRWWVRTVDNRHVRVIGSNVEDGP